MTILPSEARRGDIVWGGFPLAYRTVDHVDSWERMGKTKGANITFTDGSVLNTDDDYPLEVRR